jgi:hypothetical protein
MRLHGARVGVAGGAVAVRVAVVEVAGGIVAVDICVAGGVLVLVLVGVDVKVARGTVGLPVAIRVGDADGGSAVEEGEGATVGTEVVVLVGGMGVDVAVGCKGVSVAVGIVGVGLETEHGPL